MKRADRNIEFTGGTSTDYADLKTDCLVLGCFSDQTGWPSQLPTSTRKKLSNLRKSGDFSAKTGTVLWLHDLPGLAARRVLLIGQGSKSRWDSRQFQSSIEAMSKTLLHSPAREATVTPFAAVPGQEAPWQASLIARQLIASSYRYDHTKSKPSKPPALKNLTLLAGGGHRKSAIKTALRQGAAIGTGMNTARTLADLPANVCTPSYMARQARKLSHKQAKVTTRVLDEKQMDFLGMGALLSVSRGSAEAARLIAVDYQGADKDQAPIVLVGKGVTFDSGGISLKPGGKMDEMKYDMCGAASVMGTLQTLIELKLPINVIGLMACTENMPSGSATKPGDVITSMSGTTIEVLNTDAEGRLVLCDALSYAKQFEPKAVIDIATLTGACIVALGHHNAAVFSNDQALADELLRAGENSHDTAWQLPMGEAYQKQLDSNFADLANIGGPSAGSITAACFLSRFVDDCKWAHIDIAGVAWKSGASKGATGRPVPLLVDYLISQAN